jgi:hypothetical protein
MILVFFGVRKGNVVIMYSYQINPTNLMHPLNWSTNLKMVDQFISEIPGVIFLVIVPELIRVIKSTILYYHLLV